MLNIHSPKEGPEVRDKKQNKEPIKYSSIRQHNYVSHEHSASYTIVSSH